MEVPNTPPNSSSLRVLTRPSSSPSPTSSSTSQISLPPPIPSSDQSASTSSSSQPRSSDGVVVVGFIGRRPDITTQLINRILDSNVFGSGNLDKNFWVEKEEVRDWFKWRRISYYHEEQKGILFLQFCSKLCPGLSGFEDSGSGFDSGIEEHEFGDLQGMLFMFSVCHVIIYTQEGSRFDSQLLKKFRVLQAAKQALAPFVRSQTTSALPSRPQQLSSSRPNTSSFASSNSSPGRSRSILSRNASAISLMSGLGSYTSLFPGQCTPVMLFVFIDDFSDVPNPSSNVEESTDTSSHSQSSSLNSLTRPSLPTKASGSVVVLARPGSKSEGGFKKKLQSSLEAQIRFLIKKCRTLSGLESTHGGPRNGGVSSSAPLFSLESSRAVVLLDRSANQKGESLDFATDLVEEVLNRKATSDSLLLESHGQSANKEDIISVKEFIYKQSDILRGKGALVANSNSSSTAGVGMVAVAAAAAAASAASRKTYTTPELPNIEIWLSSCLLIIHGVICAKGGCLDDIETSERKPRLKNKIPQPLEVIASKGIDPLDAAVSCLEYGKRLNTKFSTLWCEKTIPIAKEVYLKDLLACYPTSQHEGHLEKALQAFHSMVKGPAVQCFAKKLEDECTLIWKSGRQLCDAISLTGKPCLHRRHDLETGELVSGVGAKLHSSGYVFLHACACGRSRRLRLDPFDFESANATSDLFLDCDKLLPALQLPKVTNAGPIQPSSWSLIRVGGARYYEPSKGLIQSGFCTTQKFLLKWTIFLEKPKGQNSLTAGAERQGSVIKSSTDPKSEPKLNTDMKNTNGQLYSGELQSGEENQRKSSENITFDDKKISFGNFTMRKPFSEVVAGSAAADSGFPPLQQRKQHSSGLDRSIKQSRSGDQSMEQNTNNQGPQKSEGVLSAVDTSYGIDANGGAKGDPYLRIGSNVVPVNRNSGEKIKKSPSFKHVTVYVGFEHECPQGHRFLLNPEHLNEHGTLYQLLEDSQIPSVEMSQHSPLDSLKFSDSGRDSKVHQNSSRMNATAVEKERNLDKSQELGTSGFPKLDKLVQTPRPGKQQNQTSFGVSMLDNSVKGLEGALECVSMDDSGCAFSMLNRNLPIYMNCPHCRLSKSKKDEPKVKFAGTISQLQRIFVVTPPFPVVLATCPLIQFEASCLPSSIPDPEQKLRFSLGCEVVLPPESFLSLRLPFVYGVQLADQSLHPLNYFEHQPERTAWITKGTALQIVSKRNSHGQYGSRT